MIPLRRILILVLISLLSACSIPIRYVDARCQPNQWCIYTDPPSPILQRDPSGSQPEYQGQPLRMPGGEPAPLAWRYR